MNVGQRGDMQPARSFSSVVAVVVFVAAAAAAECGVLVTESHLLDGHTHY